jgi:hypothetical protein
VPKRKPQQLTQKEVERLLSQQTIVILNAVEKKLEKTELRISQKIDCLTTTLDKFLKRLTDIEKEFEIMKADINRLKKVIKEKLGVEFA